jgi:shikimate dehydrogenase
MNYAELIGDPVAHSKSPAIHKFWLARLGLAGDYRRVRLGPSELVGYLEDRRRDTEWRGCNVTAPLKQQAAGLIQMGEGASRGMGAVNCITPNEQGPLTGCNTDIDGVRAALSGVEIRDQHVVLIGAGGAARAALPYLVAEGAGQVTIIARRLEQAKSLCSSIPDGSPVRGHAQGFDGEEWPAHTDLVVNATPMGMEGGPEYDQRLLDRLGETLSEESLAFDMVYAPVDTEFLSFARSKGAKVRDGLQMLIGQAAPAFELFFGQPAPRQHDSELRALISA